jgi:Mg2+ and Co2+ transporter CorA
VTHTGYATEIVTLVVLKLSQDKEKRPSSGRLIFYLMSSDSENKVIKDVNTMYDLMDAALDANLALIQVKQNSDMRKISAWVGIGAVPTMVAGIYGMNFENLQELQWKSGYFVVLPGALFGLFRKNDCG